MRIQGVWLPVITPLLNDTVDFPSLRKMIDFYIGKGISGIIPLGTTGENSTVSMREYEEIIANTVEYVDNRVPVFAGLGGNDTRKVIETLKLVERYKVKGILSVCPYYNKPSQQGIYEHFRRIAAATDLDIILYNIPYRTGVNIENHTVHRLAELKNIIGLKDSCGDIKQTMRLLLQPPNNFSILTGEDLLYYISLVLGADGGILASAHVKTEVFVDIFAKVKSNNHQEALQSWKSIEKIIPLLFEEPNPSPVKHILHKMGLIQSPEVRLPLTPVSEQLQAKLEQVSV